MLWGWKELLAALSACTIVIIATGIYHVINMQSNYLLQVETWLLQIAMSPESAGSGEDYQTIISGGWVLKGIPV